MSPATFAVEYLEYVRQHGTVAAYQSNLEWTGIAKDAATAACKSGGLLTQREYLRLDETGYLQVVDGYEYQRRIVVAFEVESAADWRRELYKLAHVAADLCVLVSYENHATWKAVEALEDYLQEPTLRQQIQRIRDRLWLFLFGPPWKKCEEAWSAFTLSADAGVIALTEIAGDCAGVIRR